MGLHSRPRKGLARRQIRPDNEIPGNGLTINLDVRLGTKRISVQDTTASGGISGR